MTWAAAACLALAMAMAGCGEPAGPPPAAAWPPPGLGREGGEGVVMAADAALASAYAGGAQAPLGRLLAGLALAAERRQLADLERRQESRDRRDVRRRLVHWAGRGPGQAEAVLELRGQVRLVGPGRPDPPWTGFMRQWWVRLGWTDGAWKVLEEQDLPPDRWWR